MKIALVGADFEENLGVGMIAAAAESAGHEVLVLPFNLPAQLGDLARTIARCGAGVLGLSVQFQHRATEFLALAQQARSEGFVGHITCGGQFPTLAWREVIESCPAVDSVVLHDGEVTFVDLLDALGSVRPLSSVKGIALRDDGFARRTEGRRLGDLDSLPFAKRYRPHSLHLGVPFIPVMGGRGCWGSCTFCSISTFYRDARSYAGGRTLRQRSPANLAQEMAALWHGAGSGVFCFHDDNFLLPRPEDSIARVSALHRELTALGVERPAMIGKARPDCVTPELARALFDLGVIRLYIGVENASQRGADHLGRRAQAKLAHAALAACREAGIFVCYNLLLFEPDATVNDVRENARFIREHADHPVNFCRAEPYYGTPLHRSLMSSQDLGGSWLGHNYRISDSRAETLFRVCAAAFHQRNFDPDGVGNRYMGVGYSLKLLEHYYNDPQGRRPGLVRRGNALSRAIAVETAGLLDDAIALVERGEARESLERGTARLGLRVAEADAVRHTQLDTLYDDMADFAAARRAIRPRAPQGLSRLTRQVALGASLIAWSTGCQRNAQNVVDPPPPPVSDVGRLIAPDPVPAPIMVDPAPAVLPNPTTPPIPPDPPPPPLDSGRRYAPPRHDPVPRHRVVPPTDPVPYHNPVEDPPPRRLPKGETFKADGGRRLAVIDQWTDTRAPVGSPKDDICLFDPPNVRLEAVREGDFVRVLLHGGPEAISTRWQGSGEVVPEGRSARWRPSSSTDQIRVAVRSHGGVAVLALRAVDLTR